MKNNRKNKKKEKETVGRKAKIREAKKIVQENLLCDFMYLFTYFGTILLNLMENFKKALIFAHF